MIGAEPRSKFRSWCLLTVHSTVPRTVSTCGGCGHSIYVLLNTIFEDFILWCSLWKYPIEYESILVRPISGRGRAQVDRLLVLMEADDGLSSFAVFNRVLGTKPELCKSAISIIRVRKGNMVAVNEGRLTDRLL